MHSLVFKTLSEAIPHVIETTFGWLKSFTEAEPEKVSEKPVKSRPTKTIYHKPHDTYQITGEEYDIILMDKLLADDINYGLPRKNRINQAQLTAQLNQKLGLDKSKAFYGRIWRGETPRPRTPGEPK